MKRELKFRAWDGEEMLYEFSVQSNGDGVLYCGELTEWEIMQFTGLTDKNGVEIYEGDVVEYRLWNKTGRATIVFDGGSFGLSEYDSTFEGTFFSAFTHWDEPDVDLLPNLQVIGNIHEHPHLINKTEPA